MDNPAEPYQHIHLKAFGKCTNQKETVVHTDIVNKDKSCYNVGLKMYLTMFHVQQNHHLSEKGSIIVYTTSMTVVRETHDRCRTARNILLTHMVRFEERDLYMSRQHQREVRQRLDTDTVELPQIFVDGFHIGVSVVLTRRLTVILIVCARA